MKRMIVFAVMLVLAISLGEISSIYAEEEVPMIDGSLLMGKWEGTRDMKMNIYPVPSSLEVFNDSVPLRGVLTNYGRGTTIRPFENGIIKDGKLFVQWDKEQWIRLAMYKSGRTTQLRGEFLWRESRAIIYEGTFQFKKK